MLYFYISWLQVHSPRKCCALILNGNSGVNIVYLKHRRDMKAMSASEFPTATLFTLLIQANIRYYLIQPMLIRIETL